MQLDVLSADLLEYEGDGIVVPTNSMGLMAEGIAARAKAAAGKCVEEAVRQHTPIAVGAALVTEVHSLAMRYMIHAPLLEEPGMRIGVENIRRATRASLLAAEHFEMESVGIPAMGFGEVGVSHEEAARAMIDEVNGFKGDFPKTVALVADDPDMLDALETQARSK